MKVIIAISLLLFLLTGCAAPVITPVKTQAAPAVLSVSPTQAADAQPTPLPPPAITEPMPTMVESTLEAPAQPAPAALPLEPDGWIQTSGTLTVQLLAGPDVEVNSPEYVVEGRAPAGTVVSINDEVVLTGSSQKFSSPVTLEEGPNVIEVVASDPAGQEVGFVLNILYEP